MITRFHKVLIAALAVQLVLVVVMLTRSDDNAALKEHPIVAGFDAAKATRLQVFAAKDASPIGEAGSGVGTPTASPAGRGSAPVGSIDLVKRDAGWVLASGFDYPVDAAKVNDVLGPIAKLSAAAPIATQAARHKQLHVDDADFERKLVITLGGKDVTLFIGGPAGARRTAVRVGGEADVYGVTGLSANTAGSEPRQWVEPSYVKVPRDEIARVVVQRDGASVELARPASPPAAAGSGSAGSAEPPPPPSAPEHWTATIGGAPITLAAGESLDDAAIGRLIDAVATIDLTAPADPKRDASKPAATITIERKPAGTATAAPTIIDVVADGSSYWVRDRSQPRAALVDKARLDDVVGAGRDKLVKKPPPPATQSATPPGPGSAHPGPAGPAMPRPPGAPMGPG